MSSSSTVKFCAQNSSSFVFERGNMHYYAIIIILAKTGFKTKIMSFIAIISKTIDHPTKCIIVTQLCIQAYNCRN